MNSRKRKTEKKRRGGKVFAILLSLIIFLALIVFGIVMVGRHVISSQTDNIAAKFIPDSQNLTDAADQIGSATPSAIASKLNENSDTIKGSVAKSETQKHYL
ncbi:hypothetical protein [Lactococcus cremoris]|uniref:hypothetical protein n=1 Tax=Lactococcus lactis subsp. cremoris TaxID=1359 RepID=UPI002182537D|nr:hypothetical protein [Lactococcus cremoris]